MAFAVVAGPSVPPSAHHATIPTAEHELSLLPLHSPIATPLYSQVKAMLSGTIGALLRSTISYFSVAATVPKVGERHAVTSCSANDTIVNVGTVAQLDAATESLPTTVPAAHAVIGAAKKKDVTSITEPATV